MDRMQAKEKINKLLALANNNGATDSEKETALDMARKLAAKFGFKIQQGNANTSSTNTASASSSAPTRYVYTFTVGCFNKKLVDKLFTFFDEIEYWHLIGEKTIRVVSSKKFDVDKFKEYYKRFYSIYNRERKYNKDLTANEYFYYFFFHFRKGIHDDMPDGFVVAYLAGISFSNTFNIGRG